MKTTKVCIIGHFGFGEKLLNGQTIKTKIISQEIKRQLDASRVYEIDTHNFKDNFMKVFLDLKKAVRECKNIIMLPAHNGIKLFTPLLYILKKIYHKRIHYIVIGGWLPHYLDGRNYLVRMLKYFDGIYVETQTMKNRLENQGFTNIYILSNCKELNILKENELVYCSNYPIKLCTFSRIMKEKGIEDIIDVVNRINNCYNRKIFSLDIYGQIDEKYVERFYEICIGLPSYIKYRGEVDFDKTIEIIKSYYALIFPTRFYTEGIPGTIIDSYASGVPVVSSRWESFNDIIDEGIDGYGYEFGNNLELEKVLIRIYKEYGEMDKWKIMKLECLKKAKKYLPKNAILNLIKNLDEER